MEDLKEKIKNRIDELSTEFQNLVEERNEAHQRIDQINTRIAQIVGALNELGPLAVEEKEDGV